MEVAFDEDLSVLERKECESVLEHGKIFDLNDFLANDLGRGSPQRAGKHYLANGAVYKGIQRSDLKDYEVKVEIKVADFEKSQFCGYLTIYNLTEAAAVLTTFFEAEIIGTQGNTFLTNKWDATSEIDHSFWHQTVFTNELPFDYQKVADDEELVFMRWKELFMVPDYRIRNVEGASFAGFYYICCKPKKGIIDGFYYHRSMDMFQQLLLAYYPSNSSATQQVN